VLHDVTLDIAPGSIHALVGENGAGKSTLGKIVSGVISPDAGEMLVDGVAVSHRSPRDALDVGVATIEQEVALAPRLTVRQNIMLGAEPRRAGFIRGRELARRADALIRESGFELRPSARIDELPIGSQQQVEIVRALSRNARLVVMDEPTAALDEEAVLRLHDAIRRLAATGTSVLLVSHFLKEVLALADTVTVLRDGRLVRTAPAADETEESLITAMLGRSLTSIFEPKIIPEATAPTLLQVDDVHAPGVHGVSLSVRAGEIVGLAGLGGSGRTELANAVYGVSRIAHGEVKVDGRPMRRTTPRSSLRRGLNLIPESRKDDGLFLERSTTENIMISSLPLFSRGGWLDRRRERSTIEDVMRRLGVAGGDRGTIVSRLSGGNQQKLLFARVMVRGARVLIADEPTRGVDVGAKAAIYRLLTRLAADGVAILLISSEVEEIIGLAHRVVVLHKGRVSAELDGDGITEPAILSAAFGGSDHDPSEDRP